MKSLVVCLVIALNLFNSVYLQNCDTRTSTECGLRNGTRACCPIPEGSCCQTGDFCCPRGFQCDVEQQRCLKGELFIPFHLRLKAMDNLPTKLGADILCPDNITYCKEKQTCCPFYDGTYGCCILDDANCCTDGVHCCPKNYRCNPAQGKCDRVSNNDLLESVDWFKKEEGKKIVKVEDVLCPDQTSSCPEGSTCCMLDSGEYGCCPLPNADCCSDHLHCCPQGYTCDVSAGRCNKGSLSIPFYQKTEAKKVQKEPTSVICPDKTSECPTGSTCCMLDSGEYGCCPLPQATCCSDHLHCCPNGYTCDVSSSRCNRGDISIKFLEKFAAKKIEKNEPKAVVCPGGSAQCPDGTTCCELASGEYGCCPLPKATCCSDHLHCCPNGYTCDVSSSRCNRGDISIKFFEKFAAKKIEKNKSKAVVCPGGSAQCPDGTTCCELASGEYGCCPLPKATCCSDHLHCCPNGYTCDVSSSRCNRGDISIKFFEKFAAKKIEKNESKAVVCPGGSAQCPDGTTCCELASGEYGCCPLPQATCCSDHLHCCPHGYTCDVSSSRCNRGDISIQFLEKFAAKKIEKNEPKAVVCPGGSSECPDGTTCCQLASGQYGCCPLPQATCCSDHLHCCPNGYTCDVLSSRCNRGDISISFFEKFAAKSIEKKLESVICPDKESQCPDGTTCCELSSGEYGCCPLPKATCCDDHIHCCPNGYTCDTGAGRCNKGGLSMPFMKKFSATKAVKEISQTVNVKCDQNKALNKHFNTTSVLCPDGCSFCPSGTTCCLLDSQEYGCCPLSNAVCCDDHIHCCPEGTQCNLKSQSCDGTVLPSKWVEKVPSHRLFNEKTVEKAIVCPDNLTCPPSSTCCEQEIKGTYGCCPFSEANCCDTHCCPKNTVCGETYGECVPNVKMRNFNWHTIEMQASRLDSEFIFMNKNEPVCPGGETECSNGTCCQKPDSSYACCPYLNGTCCGSHGYCCPQDYTCDEKNEACVYNDDLKAKNKHKLETCEKRSDSHTSCLNGCCPLPDGNCCGDLPYCCPKDFKCVQTSVFLNNTPMCERDDIIFSAVEKY